MSDEEFLGTIEFSVSVPVVPWHDPGEFVHDVRGKALDPNEDEVGWIDLKLVSTTEAESQAQRLLDVFDADSAVLTAIFETLFDVSGNTKEEFDIEPIWSNLLFVDTIEIKAGYEKTNLHVQLIETSIALFCPEGLAVAVEDSLELTIEDWRQLGFRRIAESPFVYRDSLKLNPYDHSHTDAPDEASYVCDACGEEIVIPLDLSQGSSQQYVEDCPVCCRAIVIHIEFEEDGEVRVWAEPEQDFD